jgi:hypothetical protein
MTLEEAKALLDEEYERAIKLDYVRKPIAYALYRVWKKADTGRVCLRTDLTNKCGSCKWSVPCKFSEKSTLGCWVECRNPNKVWRHEISKKRQRTTHKCRYYEEALEEGTE